MTIDPRFWTSDLALSLLPLVLIPTTAATLALQYSRYRQVDIPRAIAIAVPLPLAASYFAFFGTSAASSTVRDFNYIFSGLLVIIPQAFVLCGIGIWLLVAWARGREFSILSTLPIILIGFIGHWYTMMWTGIR